MHILVSFTPQELGSKVSARFNVRAAVGLSSAAINFLAHDLDRVRVPAFSPSLQRCSATVSTRRMSHKYAYKCQLYMLALLYA